MSVNDARKWVIISSLVISSTVFLFFMVAPAVDFPLEYEQSWRLLQIVFPVFLGYLASAAHFVFGAARREFADATVNELAGVLIRWPIIVCAALIMISIAAFGYTNRRSAPAGIGINIDQIASALSLVMGLLAVTTNLAVSYLFALEPRIHEQQPKA